MTEQEFVTQFVSLYDQYSDWLNTSHDPAYGDAQNGSMYGGVRILPSFDGFMLWLGGVYGH